jgi:hypothetical protein
MSVSISRITRYRQWMQPRWVGSGAERFEIHAAQ